MCCTGMDQLVKDLFLVLNSSQQKKSRPAGTPGAGWEPNHRTGAKLKVHFDALTGFGYWPARNYDIRNTQKVDRYIFL